MSTPMTPEHLQLFSTRHLEDAAHPAERLSETEEETTGDIARMARYELRRRQCTVPIRHRYASVNFRSATREASPSE